MESNVKEILESNVKVSAGFLFKNGKVKLFRRLIEFRHFFEAQISSDAKEKRILDDVDNELKWIQH